MVAPKPGVPRCLPSTLDASSSIAHIDEGTFKSSINENNSVATPSFSAGEISHLILVAVVSQIFTALNWKD